mgnify:CR=1 FL=1
MLGRTSHISPLKMKVIPPSYGQVITLEGQLSSLSSQIIGTHHSIYNCHWGYIDTVLVNTQQSDKMFSKNFLRDYLGKTQYKSNKC